MKGEKFKLRTEIVFEDVLFFDRVVLQTRSADRLCLQHLAVIPAQNKAGLVPSVFFSVVFKNMNARSGVKVRKVFCEILEDLGHKDLTTK